MSSLRRHSVSHMTQLDHLIMDLKYLISIPTESRICKWINDALMVDYEPIGFLCGNKFG